MGLNRGFVTSYLGCLDISWHQDLGDFLNCNIDASGVILGNR